MLRWLDLLLVAAAIRKRVLLGFLSSVEEILA